MKTLKELRNELQDEVDRFDAIKIFDNLSNIIGKNVISRSVGDYGVHVRKFDCFNNPSIIDIQSKKLPPYVELVFTDKDDNVIIDSNLRDVSVDMIYTIIDVLEDLSELESVENVVDEYLGSKIKVEVTRPIGRVKEESISSDLPYIKTNTVQPYNYGQTITETCDTTNGVYVLGTYEPIYMGEVTVDIVAIITEESNQKRRLVGVVDYEDDKMDPKIKYNKDQIMSLTNFGEQWDKAHAGNREIIMKEKTDRRRDKH